MSILSASRRLWMSYVSPPVVILFLSVPSTVAADDQFYLTTTPDQYITLKAEKASLKAIVEQIAQQLNITLEARIGDDEQVTDEFNNVSLERALQRISSNYITMTEDKGEKITKIFLLPQGQEAVRFVTYSTQPATAATKTQESGMMETYPKPFTFKFDPTTAMKAR